MQLPPKVKEYWDLFQPKIKPYLDRVKNNKILVLPILIVFLLIFTVILSTSQSEKQKNAQQNNIINPQETIAPIPTGPLTISRAGVFKAVKFGTKIQYFIVLKNGDALKLEVSENLSVKPFIDKNVFVSGILNEDKSTFKVDNITLFNPENGNDEPEATPVPYPNTSPTSTPSPLPLSSPINE